jgi:PD-(D/E)XK nuclease superfamily
VQTSDGRMDALVQTAHYVYCFEFKLTDTMDDNGVAALALQQIKDKGYLQPYLHQGKKCIGIGINFSKTTKKVAGLLWQEILQ